MFSLSRGYNFGTLDAEFEEPDPRYSVLVIRSHTDFQWEANESQQNVRKQESLRTNTAYLFPLNL